MPLFILEKYLVLVGVTKVPVGDTNRYRPSLGGHWRSQLRLMRRQRHHMAPQGVLCFGAGADSPISPGSIAHQDG